MHRTSWLALGFAFLLMAPLAVGAEGDGNPATGKELFDTKCAICHNADSAEKKIGPGLKGVKGGKLPSGKETTYKNVLDNLNQGGGGMPAFEKLLSAEEKDHVIAYVMTL
jgi:mono/diheme cytochrome c family protein